MIRMRHLICTLCFIACLVSFDTSAEAPVVDEGENFALLEQQQTARLPSVHESTDANFDETEPALAREDGTTIGEGNNGDLINKIQGLQQDLQELRGQLEIQSHELKLLQEQQLTFYKDLDARVAHSQDQTTQNASPAPLNLATKKPMPAVAPLKPNLAQTNQAMDAKVPSHEVPQQSKSIAISSPTTNPADEQISYLAAYELVKNKQYQEALIAMQTFTVKYPQSGYMANAQYWLGELCLVQKKYQEAIDHFDSVLQQFPSSSKYSASLLKIGYALIACNRVPEAKERLREVVKKYPDTNMAELARLKLATLGG